MRAVWFGLWMPAALLVAQNAAPSATVQGTVTDSATGAGIAGAYIQLLNQPNNYQTTSDAVGRFEITGVVPGRYRARADKDGFSSPLPEGSFLLDALNGGFQVAANADPLILDLRLTPLTTVRGRVFAVDGRPAAGVEVFLNPNIFGSVITDREGWFTLEDIRAGSYTLVARPSATAKPEISKDGTRTATVLTYYPSVTDPSLAQKLILGGQASAEYNIIMLTAPVHRVRGIVLDEKGKPSPGAEVTLFPTSQGPPEPMGTSVRTRAGIMSWFVTGLRREPYGEGSATAIAERDGRFEFPAVPNGSWEIHTGESRSSRASISVTVGRADVDELQLRMTAPFNFDGSVEWKSEDPGAQRASNPGFLTSLMTLVNADTDSWASSGFMDPRGLRFENLMPGRYKAIGKPGLAAQVFLGTTDVTGQIFPLAAGGPPIRVVLRMWSGTVRGIVEKCNGATVVLLPKPAESTAVGQFTRCSDGESFELSDVSPGDYYIAAFDRMDGLSPSAAMLNLMPSRGTSVKVEEGSAANVTLSVVPAPR